MGGDLLTPQTKSYPYISNPTHPYISYTILLWWLIYAPVPIHRPAAVKYYEVIYQHCFSFFLVAMGLFALMGQSVLICWVSVGLPTTFTRATVRLLITIWWHGLWVLILKNGGGNERFTQYKPVYIHRFEICCQLAKNTRWWFWMTVCFNFTSLDSQYVCSVVLMRWRISSPVSAKCVCVFLKAHLLSSHD